MFPCFIGQPFDQRFAGITNSVYKIKVKSNLRCPQPPHHEPNVGDGDALYKVSDYEY